MRGKNLLKDHLAEIIVINGYKFLELNLSPTSLTNVKVFYEKMANKYRNTTYIPLGRSGVWIHLVPNCCL